MPLRPLLVRLPSSHRSCSPLHSLFECEKQLKKYKAQIIPIYFFTVT